MNATDAQLLYLDRAVGVFLARLEEGYRPDNARAQACAYLRRKTGWAHPLAQGALDSAIQDSQTAG